MLLSRKLLWHRALRHEQTPNFLCVFVYRAHTYVHKLHGLQSKLLVIPLIRPIIRPCMTPLNQFRLLRLICVILALQAAALPPMRSPSRCFISCSADYCRVRLVVVLGCQNPQNKLQFYCCLIPVDAHIHLYISYTVYIYIYMYTYTHVCIHIALNRRGSAYQSPLVIPCLLYDFVVLASLSGL